MFKNLLKKKKYLDCHLMKHSIHFFYDEIRACCTNTKGPIFYPNYNGESVDWNFIYNERKKVVKEINSFWNKDEIPAGCIGCCELNSFLQDKKVPNFDNLIDRVYFHYNMSCNAKCTYCTYAHIERGFKYRVIPLVKDIIEKKILSKNACVYMSGGEITISSEFEELLSMLLNYLSSSVEILTSGIKYCNSIEQAFIQNKCRLIISLDSSTAETYKKIKQVDCFDKIVENIRNYVKASDNAKKNITLKYIIVDGVNDNIEEITNFVQLVKNLEIENIRLDFDYEKYKFTENIQVPEYYFDLYKTFNQKALELGLNVQKCEQIEAILHKSR